MKRVGFLIEAIADLDNLCLAFSKACRGKQAKGEVLAFKHDLMQNLRRLREELLSGDVSVGDYSYFTISDPKQRMICAAAFRERVLHHALMNVCHPYFDRVLIADTYATRRGKGIYAALDKANQGATRYRYVVKLDVRKYFDSIQHATLKIQLRRMFKDARLLRVFDRIIDSFSISDGRGLPIGNLTSQYFANHYLSGVDHHVKEQLRIPCYVRYMDDMLLFGHDEAFLHDAVYCLQERLDEIGLSLKTPVFRDVHQGVDFLGYKIYPRKRLLERRSKIRFARKMREYMENLNRAIWAEKEYAEHVLPLIAFVRQAATKRYRMSVNSRLIIEGG